MISFLIFLREIIGEKEKEREKSYDLKLQRVFFHDGSTSFDPSKNSLIREAPWMNENARSRL